LSAVEFAMLGKRIIDVRFDCKKNTHNRKSLNNAFKSNHKQSSREYRSDHRRLTRESHENRRTARHAEAADQ
jgi:hypothetical protein